MTLYLVFKIGLLCLVPIVILAIIRENESLRNQLSTLRESNVKLNLIVNKDSSDTREKILFISDNKSERLELYPHEVLLIRSADNYVEVVYQEDNAQKQKLIRTTMKGLEHQLKVHGEFLRCHRTCIVNTKYIVKLKHGYSGYSLKMHGYDKEVPVSRQYLLPVRDVLNIN
jgi:DNA-binding LytR/AlgR family response regulator